MAEQGGAVEAVPYMKAALVESHRERIARIESGEQVLVGVNRFTETEPSPLTARTAGSSSSIPRSEAEQRRGARRVARRTRRRRRPRGARRARARGRDADENVMPATIAAARAGATTGEWAQTLREAFGSYRAPTGVGEAAAPAGSGEELAALREEVERVAEELGRGAEDPRRQAGARRPLQRRRADRRPRARRGDGGRLRGHPAHAGADRALRGGRGRARDRAVDPLRLAPRAHPGRPRGAARRGRRRHPGRGRRDHPRGRRGRRCGRPASPRSTRRRTSS